ncbi:unnamed protein product [Calicophoron daubneyi]|uniref:Uncharacterized protein n=1 Tax=Calicophoron daubneyi TaxID=300641 RepID=A0AAV2TJV6_CALDB
MAAVGIDLGTTNSCVAICQNGVVEILTDDEQQPTIPSCVSFTDGGVLIGREAKIQLELNPENTIYDFKRLIGRRYDDPMIKEDTKHWPFSVVQEDGRVKIEVHYKGQLEKFLPEKLAAMLLSKIKKMAENILEEHVTDAVITVPAYFNSLQREAIKSAGEIAKLNVLQVLDEPTAAAIAYGFGNNQGGRQLVLVFDFGGGTLDVSVLSVEDKNIVVKATAGDNHLGGEDFDQNIANYMVERIKDKHNIDITAKKKIVQYLHLQCEKAKQELSSATSTNFVVEPIDFGKIYHGYLTREKFNDLNSELFKKALTKVSQALEDAKLKPEEINEVILVGGSVRIPKIQQILSEYFTGEKINKTVNPDEVVARGAAIYAAYLKNKSLEQSYDIEVVNVVPYSLGTECYSGQMDVLIKRNTPIPAKASMLTRTVRDNQSRIRYRIYEGEHLMAKDNQYLNEFSLDNLTLAPRGQIKVLVEFKIDENGILTVSASECDKKNIKHLQIKQNYESLCQEDIDRIAAEVEALRQDNEEHLERLSVWNELEALTYRVEEKVRSLKDQNPSDRTKYGNVEKRCDETFHWLQTNQTAPLNEYSKRKMEMEEIWSSLAIP